MVSPMTTRAYSSPGSRTVGHQSWPPRCSLATQSHRNVSVGGVAVGGEFGVGVEVDGHGGVLSVSGR